MTAQVCSVPSILASSNLADGLRALQLPFRAGAQEPPPVLDLSGNEFLDPAAIVALAAFCADYRRRTKNAVQLTGIRADSYIARVGLKKLAGHVDDYPYTRHASSDRFTDIVEVADFAERGRAREHILDVLGINHQGSRDVLDYCVEEILRNVEDHADSRVNALVQAQFYEKRSQVVVGIADTGAGVLHSLRQWHQDLDTDAQALQKAMRAGVSGRNTRKGSNAGLGLTVTSTLVSRMGGTFRILSGTAMLEVTRDGTNLIDLSEAPWQGVLVTFCVPRNDALDWDSTFVEVMGAL